MTIPTTRSAGQQPAGWPCPLDLELSDVVGEDPPPSALEIRVELGGPLAAIHLAGELDQDSEGLLRDAVDCLATKTLPAEQVVLDLSGITFCDVAGLRVLESCAAALRLRGQQLAIRHPSAVVARLATLGAASADTGTARIAAPDPRAVVAETSTPA